MLLPVVGETLSYVADPLAFMRRHHERSGPVAEVRMLGVPWTVLTGPDACGVALLNADKAFANGPGWGYLVGPFFDRGLMLLDFKEHHQHRLVLQQAFTRPRISAYVDALAPAVSTMLDSWSPGTAVPIYPLLKQMTLDIATEVFMGGVEPTDDGELERVNRAFVDCVQAAGAMVRLDVPGTRWRRATRGRALLDAFVRRQIPVKRASPGTDLLSVLCTLTDDDGVAFGDDDVVNHMIFFLMAAHDTSTITLTTILALLGQHPEWQDRCRAESAALLELATHEQLETLESFDLVLKEALRLTAPVPVVARRTVKATEVLGQGIPAGRMVSVMLAHAHHSPELWSDPERFDPERFSAERREDRSHRHAWTPFGAGVHKCLGMAFAGMEVGTVLHQLLRRFEWRLDPDYRPPMNNHSLPFPTDGLPLELRPLRPSA